MTQRMLAGGLIAGFAAGLLAALLHFAFLQKLILLGEDYESGALVHFAGAEAGAAPATHDQGADASHEADAGDEGALSRNVMTILFTGLTYASYGLLLIAGFALADRLGHRVDARGGLMWGIGAFLAFQLAPAMGLPPELPGTVAADITPRQVWYFGTVLATGLGLVLLVGARGFLPAVLGGVLIAAPHAIGAPHPDTFQGVAPPELAAAFTTRVLGVGFVAWAVLGWLGGRYWARTGG